MKINNILICLDLSKFDSILVEYALYFLSKLPGEKQVTLFHNIRYDFLGGELGIDVQDVVTLKETIVKNIRVKHKNKFSQLETPFDIIVQDYNSTADAILTLKEELEIDLLVTGKKLPDEGAGIIPLKILSLDQHKTPILLVSSGSVLKLNKLLAPIDLSKITNQIIGVADYFQSKEPLQKIGLFIYKLPVTYFPYFESSDEKIEHRLKKKAETKINKFLSTNEHLPDDSWEISIKKGVDISKAIIKYTLQNEVDLIIIGRIGRTDLLGNQLGGTTRRVITAIRHRPILII